MWCTDVQVLPEPERPIDLFKAIFEADADDDEPDNDDEDEVPASAVVKAEPSSDAGTAVGGGAHRTPPGEASGTLRNWHLLCASRVWGMNSLGL